MVIPVSVGSDIIIVVAQCSGDVWSGWTVDGIVACYIDVVVAGDNDTVARCT